jgi:hypothetical protein
VVQLLVRGCSGVLELILPAVWCCTSAGVCTSGTCRSRPLLQALHAWAAHLQLCATLICRAMAALVC